ncbi:hypothetical protein OPT61_g8332 [Boeremia exigua]|uniref:Uncharacterized protein n=1 Tax=Boeremia exigua TaxID=749465 RepID=A0ACC2I0C5_9PLEO|nr:hypothetical protein OPT61_g8332 [Boeremia exigua]
MSLQGPPPIQYYDIPNFTFYNGDTLPNVRLAYQILNPRQEKIAVVHTCFRGRIPTTLNHADYALRDYKVIVIAQFGNGESSSPSNTPKFPSKLDYMDCIKAQHKLLTEELKIDQVDVMLGFSMGGQITYHWITKHRSFVKNAIIVCSSAKTSRHNFQFLEGPKAGLQNAKDAESGIRAFGKGYSAWLTSAEWFDQELYKEMGFESLEAWDENATFKGYEGWTGDDLLAMLGMWQRGDIARCGQSFDGDLVKALKYIDARVLLMPCETDQYFRPQANEREAGHLKGGQVAVVPSVWGHIAGGGSSEEDTRWMERKIAGFLKGGYPS